MSSNMKLLLGADGQMYAGGGQRLFRVNFQADYFQDQVKDLCVFVRLDCTERHIVLDDMPVAK